MDKILMNNMTYSRSDGNNYISFQPRSTLSVNNYVQNVNLNRNCHPIYNMTHNTQSVNENCMNQLLVKDQYKTLDQVNGAMYDQTVCAPHSEIIVTRQISPGENSMSRSAAMKRPIDASVEYGRSSPAHKKRKPVFVQNENKDDQYWEKRRKNNESAKRSRLARHEREKQYKLKIEELLQKRSMLKMQLTTAINQMNLIKNACYSMANRHVDISNQLTFDNLNQESFI
ncbi:hypothetical protein GJ496_006623 [Pomphorhynchus laevis]|nr:hypothetical protein GJ496_002235 [Pomphorhynchus laevis]KAI0989524.1 hypothetical protein GJ496_006623 [Pomphorhynchus laevis]